LIFTLVLAILFTSLQGLEYVEAPFCISDSVFGSCFYMATGFHGARVRRIVGFFIQGTSAGIMYLIQSLEAFYGDVWSCLDMNNINSSCFKATMSKGVKRLSRAIKTSVNYSQALIGVVSKVH